MKGQYDVVLRASEKEVGLLIATWRRSRGVTALKENFLKLTSHTLASMFKEDVMMCGSFTTDSRQTVRVMQEIFMMQLSSKEVDEVTLLSPVCGAPVMV
ncbi:hypothetical protein ROHU_020226 [Labeo rohita]|uniref:Uncharacterized protein n=1 Tax=Labeo rohita TaxID=84645 RepID=A0A498NCL8_LABRO|nr:hypothetical protein ROHU_020226 [Labeo rohita]